MEKTTPKPNQKIMGEIKMDDLDNTTVSTGLKDGDDQNDEEGAATNMLQPNNKISKNDFIFCQVIGRGSFGKVYMVKKKDKPEVPLALKVLQKDVVAKRNLLIKTQGNISWTI